LKSLSPIQADAEQVRVADGPWGSRCRKSKYLMGKRWTKTWGTLEKMGLDNMENDVKKTLFWCPICLLFELSPLTNDHDWLLVSNTLQQNGSN